MAARNILRDAIDKHREDTGSSYAKVFISAHGQIFEGLPFAAGDLVDDSATIIHLRRPNGSKVFIPVSAISAIWFE